MIWLRLAPFIIAAAAIAAALWFWGDAISWKAEADKYKTALATAEEVNEHMAKTIARVENERKIAEDLAVHLAKENDKIHGELAEKNEQLRQIEEQFPDVKDFLNLPIPDDLGRVLNNDPARSSEGRVDPRPDSIPATP